MIKIWFFGTPELAHSVLEVCVNSTDFEVVYVVTRPDKPVGRHATMTKSPVRVFAELHNIPVFTPPKVRGNVEFLSEISVYEVDYLVVVAYGSILPKEVLALPRKLPVNVHGSLLPKYRGASPIQASLLAWDKETGITIMQMTEGMDEGAMLRKYPISINPKETSETLFAKFAEISGKSLLETLRDYDRGNITPALQDDTLATYCTKISKEDGKIDFTQSAISCFRKWQAYTPWPGIWCEWNGLRCKIIDCKPTEHSGLWIPGTCSIHDQEVLLTFSEGQLTVITLQIEGKNPISALQFVRSHRDPIRFL